MRFLDNGVIWQILNPVRMLTALAWAAVAGDQHSMRDEL